MNELYLLIDNSNIWIGAKEYASRISNFDTTQDPRVRLDYFQLTHMVANGRQITGLNLYGSKPPPNDALWSHARSQGFKVIVYDRSAHTGREKKVDGQIITDLMEIAFTNKESTVALILLTGDADMVPCLNSILRCTKATVEIFGWRGSMSRDYFELMRRNTSRIHVRYLNQEYNKFTFVNYKFASTKLRKGQDDALVFTVDNLPDKWEKSVENFTKWPFQYFKYDQSTLVVVFCPDANKWFDTEQCKEAITNGNFVFPYTNVQVWQEFVTEKISSSDLDESTFYE